MEINNVHIDALPIIKTKEIKLLETLKELSKCELCGKTDEHLSLYRANHKDLGWIDICRECWVECFGKNRLVAGSGSKSSGCNCGIC